MVAAVMCPMVLVLMVVLVVLMVVLGSRRALRRYCCCCLLCLCNACWWFERWWQDVLCRQFVPAVGLSQHCTLKQHNITLPPAQIDIRTAEANMYAACGWYTTKQGRTRQEPSSLAHCGGRFPLVCNATVVLVDLST
jgi:hypothetical protein